MPRFFRRIFSVVMAAVLTATAASAASRYYDTAATAGFPANASFTWNTTTAQWTGSGAGSTAPVAWVNAGLDDAILGSGTGTSAYTASLGGDIAVGRIQRVNGTWSVDLGTYTLTLNSTTDWTFGGTGYGPINGTGGIIKAGANTLTLSGNNTFTGTTTVNAGTLRATTAGALGAGSLVLSGGTLSLAGDSGLNFGRNATVTGNATIVSDRITPGAAVTHTLGTLAIGTQTLAITRGGSATSGTAGVTFGATTLTGNSTFDTGANTALTLGALNDGGAAVTVTKQGSGALTLGTAATSLGNGSAFNILGGTLNSNDAAALGSLANITLASGATFGIGANQIVGALNGTGGTVSLGANTLTVGSATNNLNSAYGGTITGTGAINKSGAGALVLGGNNSFSGGLLLNVGTLQANTDTAFGTGTLWVYGGTTLQAGGTGTRTLANTLSVSGDFTIGGAQDLTFNGPISLGGGARTIQVNNSGVTTFAGVVSNSWYSPLTKTGSGTLVLSGANTFQGPMLINEGIVSLRSNSAMGASTNGNIVASGAELQLQGGITVNEADLSIQGSGVSGAGAIHSVSGNNTLTTALTLAGATTLGVTSGSLTLTGSLTVGQTLDTTGAGNLIFNGTLYGTGAMNINGNTVTIGGSSANSTSGTFTVKDGGTLVLAKTAGTTAHQGLFAIADGTLRLDASDQIADSHDVNLGGAASVFDLNGNNETIANLRMTGSKVTTGTGTLTISSSGGTVTTNASDTTATISGKLSSTAWATNFVIADGAATTDLEISAAISGASNLVKKGAGTMVLSGNNTYTGTTTVDLGTLKLGAAGSTTSGPLGTAGGGTVVNAGGALDLNGFSVNTSEAFTLNSSGVNGAGALTNSSTGAVSLAGSVTLGSAATIGGVGDITLNGALGGNHLLTKAGDSRLTLNASAGTRTGGARIDAGTLVLGNAAALGAASQTITLSGGSLDLATDSSVNAYAIAVTSNGTISVNKATAASAGITHTLGTLSVSDSTLTINAGAKVAANSAYGITFGATTLSGTATFDVANNGAGAGTVTLGTVSGTGGLTKTGTGTLALGGANSYTGPTAIQQGTVIVSSLANVGGGNSSLGAPTTAANGTIKLGYQDDGATLRYTGSGSTTDRVIDLAGTTGGATIDASGSGAVVFSSAFTASGDGSKTLTLTGTNTGANTLAGAIVDHSAGSQTSLVKTGAGNWILGGQNTFSGAIAVNAGTLTLTANNALGARNAVTVAAGATFAVSGGSSHTTTIGGLSGSGVVSIAAATVLQLDQAANNTFAGRLSGAGLFVKQGSSTLTFSSSANTSAFNFSGTLELDAGTLEFQGGSSSNALAVGTLKIDGGTLLLSNAFINVGTLDITGDTILDFGTGGASILKATNIYIASGVTVTVRNWTSEVDFLFANSSFRQGGSSGTQAEHNVEGSAPQNQVHFEADDTPSDGSNTAWTEYLDNYEDHQIRPIPEPSTYGAMFVGACATLVLALRRRRGSRK